MIEHGTELSDTEGDMTEVAIPAATLPEDDVLFGNTADMNVYDISSNAQSAQSSAVNSEANSVPGSDSESSSDGFGPSTAVTGNLQSEQTNDIDHVLENETVRKLNNAWIRQLHDVTAYRPTCITLPWERRDKMLCTSIKLPELPRSTVFRSVVNDETVNTTVGTMATASIHPDSAWWAVKSRIAQIDWKAQLDCKRHHAMERCRTLLQLDPSKSEVGRTILADMHTLASDERILDSIMNVFANKATKTILKRTGAFQKFVSWCLTRNIVVYPVLESNAYAYLQDMRHRPPSFAAGFKEALNFMHGTLGIDGCKLAAESRRLIGYCMNQALNKRPRVQAPPLTCKQISYMEQFVCSDADPIDRVFIGHCLLCTYTRSRWEDLQHACEPKLDLHRCQA